MNNTFPEQPKKVKYFRGIVTMMVQDNPSNLKKQ